MNITKLIDTATIILLIIGLSIVFFSCNDTSKRKARVSAMRYVASTGKYEIFDSIVTIIIIDTSYRAGDVIEMNNTNYKIIN
jgi:hypothetical protein